MNAPQRWPKPDERRAIDLSAHDRGDAPDYPVAERGTVYIEYWVLAAVLLCAIVGGFAAATAIFAF